MTRSETSQLPSRRRRHARRAHHRSLELFVSLAALTAMAGATVPDALAQARRVPLPVPAPKSPAAAGLSTSAPSQPEPKPDTWSASEIADAKRICEEALKSVAAKFVPLPPIKIGRCGAPAPVRLISIGDRHPVEFVPAPTVSCRMLKPLQRWIDNGLQAQAAKRLETRVTQVSVMSSYSCRTRYGRKGARMSEHAFANAIDIGAFRLADGTRVNVLDHWGTTRRDVARAAEAARQRRAAETVAAAAPNPDALALRPRAGAARAASRRVAAPPPLPPVHIERRSPAAAPRTTSRTRAQRRRQPAVRPQRSVALPTPLRNASQRSSSGQPPPLTRTPANAATARGTAVHALPPLPQRRPLRRAVGRSITLDKPRSKRLPRAERLPGGKQPPFRLGGPKPSAAKPRALFLRAIHRSACRIFGTTLGPEANEAHRNHFHFDMFPRRRSNYCE